MSDDAVQVKIWGCVDIWIDGIRIYRCGTSEMKNVGYDSAFLVRMREERRHVAPPCCGRYSFPVVGETGRYYKT